MRILASFIFTSLDGFYEGPNGEIDWPSIDEEFNDFAVRQLDGPDTLVFGRATYEHMAGLLADRARRGADPAVTSRMNDKEKLVFSSTLTEANWSGTTVVRGDVTQHVTGAQGCCGQRSCSCSAARI